MKKLPMIVAIVVSIFSAQGVLAQDELVENDGFEHSAYEYEQHEYAEITNDELPFSIQIAARNDYYNFRIHKAYISKDHTYKVILKDHENYTKIVFASANGKWIKPNDKS